MEWKVDASFDRGVFVPETRPRLSDGARVRLTIEPARTEPSRAPDTDRPMSPTEPTGTGLALALDYHPDGC
jgi:hypothetical protein